MARAEQGGVAVLLALYNGARHLDAQLDSLAAQDLPDWRLIVSDDGSQDESLAIVERFAKARPGQVTVIQGPGEGAAANFRHLIARAPNDAGYLSLCDQDDVWLPQKLSRAVAHLSTIPHDQPAIWCSRTTVCNEDLATLDQTPFPLRPIDFRNALIQNVVIGHTLVLNRAAIALVRAAHPLTGPVAMHDWWIYQLVTGAGGKVVFDPRPSSCYRQHGGNAVGAGTGMAGRLAALGRMRRGKQRGWNRLTLAAMEASAAHLTPENRALLADFSQLLHGGLLQRLRAMRRGGFTRQFPREQAALWLAVVFGWV